MNIKILLGLVVVLSLVSPSANGEPADTDIIGPTPFQMAAPARWRDGYINWKRRKVFAPDWRSFKSDLGDDFVIDMKSIVNLAPTGTLVRVVAYLVEGDDYDPKRLIQFAFNCKDFVEVVTSVSADRLRPIEEQAKKLACQQFRN